MKKYTILIVCLLLSIFTQAQQDVNTTYATQITQAFQPLNKNKVPHGILLDFGMEFTNVQAFNGTLTDSTYTNSSRLKDIYNTLLMSRIRNVTQGIVNPEEFNTRFNNNRATGVIAISGLFFNYAKFKDNALTTNKLTYVNGKFYDKYNFSVWQNPYEVKQTFAMAPAIQKYKGFTFEVKLPTNIFYSNVQNQVQNIQIDFDNGQGYVSLPFNQNVAVNYTTEGVKNWTYKLTLTNGTVLYNQSKIEIEEGLSTIPFGSTTTASISSSAIYSHTLTATKPYNGQYASVNLTIDDANNDGIRNPLIVAEGFDLGIVVSPENVNGMFDYNDFQDFVSFGGVNLMNLIHNSNKQYDIIYVDWHNGIDYMQRNAFALQEVIKWVNQQKVANGSTTQNVVLGQSMGGVIARYALADMEENNEVHDTRLFVSHDAPQQGANVPISLQDLNRHIERIYIQAPIGTIAEFAIPLFNINNGITPLDYLTLLDAPASKQLIKNWVNINYQINNTAHDTFYTELRNKGVAGSGGYPTLNGIRNIAISNGSECGETQDFNTGDHLLNVQLDGKFSAIQSLIVPFAAGIGGVLTGSAPLLGVSLLGLVPGSSRYVVDFQAKALYNTAGNMIYKGRVAYHKKVLFVFNTTINITDVEKHQPNGLLPFDNYGGGFYNVNNFMDTANLPYGIYMRNKFNFIPTASTLDIGGGNVNLLNEDYLRSYVGALPPVAPKNSPFDNFTTEFDNTNPNTHNKQHITFNTRNGDWLAAELIATNIEYTDCSAFCANANITGDDFLCDTGIYTVTNEATDVNWSINDPNNLVTFTTNFNEITLNQTNTSQSGYITLNVTYGNNRCGSVTISKDIWVGIPKFPSAEITGPNSPITGQDVSYIAPSAEGVTSYHWSFDRPGWSIIQGQGSTSVFVTVGQQGLTYVRCEATNACGTSMKYLPVRVRDYSGNGNGHNDPCDNIVFSENPMNPGKSGKYIWITDPCDPLNNNGSLKIQKSYKITIFDKYYRTVYSQTQSTQKFDVSTLKTGFYIVSYQSKSGALITKKLIIPVANHVYKK